MTHGSVCCLTAHLAWTVTLFRVSFSDVYTSSKKIEDMVLLEDQILNNLHTAVTELGNGTASSFFSRFYRSRMPKVIERQNDAGLQKYLHHPNAVYQSIKEFATEYQNLRTALAPSVSIQKQLSSIADQTDIVGATLSFLRLQTVYNLHASDMIKGNFLGFMGPQLNDIDALKIGQAAFSAGRLEFAIEWLQEALLMSKQREPSAGFINPDQVSSSSGVILALLGRSYIRQGNKEKATEMYRQARYLDPKAGDVAALEHELQHKPEFYAANPLDENFKRLCSLQNKLTQSKFDRRLNCSYKEVILPYIRVKMELLSISPYVVLYYDVITDFESQTIVSLVRQKLQRGRVENDGNSIAKESRTSDLSFVDDYESTVVSRMSKWVGAITNLDTTPPDPNRSYAGEPFQVVNYGMGGHYEMHFDPFNEKSFKAKNMQSIHASGGNRLATFLIYLTDVERGGSTVFPEADMAVNPVKKMALFWYSYKPNGKLDKKTIHAGCPVVIGHKWVTNKWIWQFGNTFTRRCGLTKTATQLDIDQDMRRGWA